MPHVETAAGALSYVARGSGAVVVIFIHGAGGSHRHWGALFAGLPAGLRRYALDLPGHGRSTGAAQASIAGYAAAVAAFAEQLGLARAVLVGHSMGGAIALELALQRPDFVQGLGLIATGARFATAPLLLDALRRSREQALAQLLPLLYGPQPPDGALQQAERELRAVAQEVLERDYAACAAYDPGSSLSRISAPAAVICGSEDRMTTPEQARLLHEQLPGSLLGLVEGVGHMLMLEAPDAVAAALLPLFSTAAPAGE